MNDKEYIKTYKPLIAWLIGFPIMIIFITKFIDSSEKISVLISLIMMVISLYILMLIIYKGQYVYWINGGPSYEEAKIAGSEKRKQYAKAHLDLFGKMTLVCFIYGLISLLFRVSIFIDIIIISGAIIVTAFQTVPIKFGK